MDETRLEAKVGAFALVALALGVGLVLALSGLRRGESMPLIVDFSYSGGVEPGAVVKLAGVKVGRVRSVELRPEGRDTDGGALPVRVTLEIDASAGRSLGRDSTATIATQGALGEVYVELMPGLSREPLTKGEALRGIAPPRLDIVLARISDFLADAQNEKAFRSFLVELAELARTVTGLLGENREQVVEFLRRAGETLESGQRTVGDARMAVQEIRTLVHNTNALVTSAEIQGLVADLAAVSKSARTDLPQTLHDTRELVARLEKTTGALKPDDVERIKATVAQYEALAGDLRRISSSADALLTGIQKGEGSAGLFVKDPKVYQDLRDLLDDLKKHPWKFLRKD